MRIISRKHLVEFSKTHADAKIALEEWFVKSEKSQWKDLNDIKRTFGSVDYVGNKRFVFNIRGNNYRLVALILFKQQIVYIRFVGTHVEYDKIDCSKI